MTNHPLYLISCIGELCTASTSLADLCPLDFGGSGDGCQPPNLITTLINIALKPGDVDEPMFPGNFNYHKKNFFINFSEHKIY
jgi:hypothetical protein